MNLRPARFLLRQKPPPSSESLARPWQYCIWGLSLTLSILLPLAFAWFHRIPPSYTLTDLGVGAIQAVSGNAAFSISQPASIGSPAAEHPPTSNFVRFSNAAGQAAWSEYRGRVPRVTIHAFFASQSKTIDLGTLGGKNCLVTGLSASGHVIGASHTHTGEQHAFLWKEGQMLDLGTLPGGRQSEATAINARDEIVGAAQTEAGNAHAFFWSNGVMTDLGLLPQGTESWAYALNNRGEVVGGANTEAGDFHAVVWKGGHIQDLNRCVPNQADRFLEQARAINDRGQIVSWGFYRGRYHPFLLTPTP